MTTMQKPRPWRLEGTQDHNNQKEYKNMMIRKNIIPQRSRRTRDHDN